MENGIVRAVLFDLEGTLYARGVVLPGAVEAVARLREAGLPLRFLTNTDSKTVTRVSAELEGYGLDVPPDEVFTPVVAAQGLLGAPDTRVHTLVSRELEEAFPRAVHEPPYTHVLLGDCRDTLDYQTLDDAFRAVRGGAELLALQRGRYFKRADGDHLDTGAIVSAVEYAAGVTARVLGKPSTEFLELAVCSLGVTASECVVVGDDATTDIAGGLAAGALTVQVRTGKYADQAAEGLIGRAHFEVESAADLPGLLWELVAK